MRAAKAVILAATMLLPVAGCGGSSAGQRVSGRGLFAADCSHCHSLVGNESLARPGGDLLGYRLSRFELAQFIREMPLRHPLGRVQLAAVATYVLAKERLARGR